MAGTASRHESGLVEPAFAVLAAFASITGSASRSRYPNELLTQPMLQPDQVTDSLHAYQLAKRGNTLGVMAEVVRWGKRSARINTISPASSSLVSPGTS